MRAIRREDIYFQNDFEDDVVNNPKKYNTPDLCSILYIVGKRHVNGHKIFDYLLVNSLKGDYYEIFISNLYNNGLYANYMMDIEDKSDKFVKAYASLFLNEDFMERIFDNNTDEVAKALVEVEGYESDSRVLGLLKLSEYPCSKDTVKYIKDSIIRIMDTDEEYKSLYSEEQIKKDKVDYLEYIDKNQKKQESINLTLKNEVKQELN